MKSFLSALQFLTIIPIKIKNMKESYLSRSLIYFPIIGLILGLILVSINKLLLLFLNFTEFSLSIILVVSLIILTGGIHLDGLSDTFDALLSRKNKEEMLKIMRDSHIGVMGVLSIISVLLLKISFLYSISVSLKSVSLILMCLLSRWGMVFSMYLFPYAREEGKAKVFIAGINLKIFILSSLITLIYTFFIWNIKGLIVLIIIIIFICIFTRTINKKIGGITGDTLGAINELTEVIVLLSVCLLERINL